MDVAVALARIEEQFEGGDPHGALAELAELVSEIACRGHDDRMSLLDGLVARVDHEQPALAAHFALAAGTLIEAGLDARPLAEAILEPVARTIAAASRFVALAEEYPHEPGAVADDEDFVEVGGKTLSGMSLAAIADRDDDAVASYFALDTWYRPVVTAWSKCPAALRKARAHAGLSRHLGELAGRSEGAEWIALLLGVPVAAPLVVLVPELNLAWFARVTGVVDIGQLIVLLASTFDRSLARFVALEPPPREVVDIMSGRGLAHGDVTFRSRLRLYPSKGMLGSQREDAPSEPVGSVGHAWGRALAVDSPLPLDHRLGLVEPLADGTRVLVLAGTRPSPQLGLREIPATRALPHLEASLDGARELSSDERSFYERKWLAEFAS